MTDAYTRGPFLRLVQTIHNQISEVVRICSVYLGIAVLVGAAVIVIMPGLRGQAATMHTAWLTALMPDPTQPDLNDAMRQASSPRDFFEQPPVAGSFQDAFKGRPPIAMFRSAGVSKDQVEALRRYIARKYKVAYDATGVLVSTAFTVARKYELDPLLILAVVAIESRYNPLAESHVGAQGLMQVMTSVHKDKLEEFGEGDGLALDPIVNMHVGSQILRDCVKRRGSVKGGLACYVGATGPSDGGYGAKVLAERRRLALAADVPLDR